MVLQQLHIPHNLLTLRLVNVLVVYQTFCFCYNAGGNCVMFVQPPFTFLLIFSVCAFAKQGFKKVVMFDILVLKRQGMMLCCQMEAILCYKGNWSFLLFLYFLMLLLRLHFSCLHLPVISSSSLAALTCVSFSLCMKQVGLLSEIK